MSNWIWPTESESWPIVKEKKVWAVGKEGKGKRVQKGDRIIFYVKGTMHFHGIFEVKSDWHDRTTVWPDQKHGSEVLETGAEIDLEIIQLGYASVHKLYYSLNIDKKKDTLVLFKRNTYGSCKLS